MNDLFSRSYLPYLNDLQSYCRKLTSSKWEAEDLVQETMIRLYKASEQEPNRPISKAYVRRVAKNAWIDRWRKKRITTVTYEDSMDLTHDPIDIREAFEVLADCLSVRQMVLILLIDIFQFTARETAQLINLSEGAVKEGIRRARKKLQQMILLYKQNPKLIHSFSLQSRAEAEEKSLSPAFRKPPSKEMFETFLSGFRSGNPHLIYEGYNSLVNCGVKVVKVKHTENLLSFTFRDPNGHLLSFFSLSEFISS